MWHGVIERGGGVQHGVIERGGGVQHGVIERGGWGAVRCDRERGVG